MLSGHRAAVLGSPIAHSLSPVLHRAAYAWLRLDDWSYEAVEVADQAGLREILDAPWAGLSLTMPLKRMVLPLLDEVTDLARDVGAVNTVIFGPGGRTGHNTDVHGLRAALTGAGLGSLPAGTSVVLGGGATAASALAALGQLGDGSPALVVRDGARARQTLAAGERLGLRPRLVAWADAAHTLGAASVVVSTVPASAGPAVLAVLPQRVPGLLLDVVYDPWPTPLALAWRAAGGRALGGFEMLLHQAHAQVRLMTGRDPAVAAMRAAGLAALAERS